MKLFGEALSRAPRFGDPVARASLMETLTDERLEPHFFLAGLLLLAAIVAVVLFWVVP